jgi:23S rRNA pseudouridine1911/1915/1917 synthase
VPKRPPARLKLAARAPDQGTPLLRFVTARGGVSEEAAKAAILRGGAFLRGRRERDPGKAVSAGDRVEIDLREPVQAALGKERILHLDEQILAVDKPAGLSAQEDRGGGPSILDFCGKLLGGPALLVHRLDRGTTGVTVLARTRAAQAALLEEFRRHRARKEYRALVAGAPGKDEETVDLPVAGAAALTRFRVLERFPEAALVSALPETGRTHQIRIHLRELGCPLLGDARHGGPLFLTRPDGRRIDFERPLLHALSLELRGLKLRAPLPPDFETALAFLRR